MQSQNKPKRGAPFGNTNSLKSGLYARLLHERAIHNATTFPFIGLETDLELIRYLSRRVKTENLFSTTQNPAEAENTFILLLLARAIHIITTQNYCSARNEYSASSPLLSGKGSERVLPLLIETAFAQLLIEFHPETTHPANPEPGQE